MTKTTSPAAPSVGFISLGCPKNLVDSEVMMGLLDRAGARLTSHPEEAEVLVVNTCSFIDTAKQESVDTILEMARFKTEGSAKKLIVAGCLVERYRDEIRKSIPEVDAVVGTGELESILEAAGIAPPPVAAPGPFNILSSAQSRPGQESLSGTHKSTASLDSNITDSNVKGTGFGLYEDSAIRERVLDPEVPGRPEGDLRQQQGRFSRDDWQGAAHMLPTYLYNETTPRFLTTPSSSAYIKIAEGCDHPCTFCVIPNLRGKFRSRRFESVVAEAQQLVARGVQEITLIGQDTTCYGEDLGLKDGLATLLGELAGIEGLRWLRFLYAYPNRITGKLLET
ncbi:MAG TPA: radical SAM protein, partial [Terracidiphilus sp.]|nr:radical SAM protein [Terracidiphilus sp.]